MAESPDAEGTFGPSFHAILLSDGLVCSGDEHRGSGEGCDGVGMTIGHGNWNGCHFGTSWCFGNAAEMFRQCCEDAVVVPLLPRCNQRCCTAAAGRQAGPRCVFSRAIAAIFPEDTSIVANHACHRHVCRLHWA
jgi:hypothetical protein